MRGSECCSEPFSLRLRRRFPPTDSILLSKLRRDRIANKIFWPVLDTVPACAPFAYIFSNILFYCMSLLRPVRRLVFRVSTCLFLLVALPRSLAFGDRLNSLLLF